MDQLKAWGQKLNPLAENIQKGMYQAKQFAQEKMGTAEEVTDLPPEYKDLERKTDNLRSIQEKLTKLGKHYASMANDTPLSLSDVSRTVTDKLSAVTLTPADRDAEEVVHFSPDEQSYASPSGRQNYSSSSNETPRTVHHALAKTATQGADLIGREVDPFAAALSEFGDTQEKIGDLRLRMENEVSRNFVGPFGNDFGSSIQSVMKARKNVNSLRLKLDSNKAR